MLTALVLSTLVMAVHTNKLRQLSFLCQNIFFPQFQCLLCYFFLWDFVIANPSVFAQRLRLIQLLFHHNNVMDGWMPTLPSEELELTANSLGAHIETHGKPILRTLPGEEFELTAYSLGAHMKLTESSPGMGHSELI